MCIVKIYVESISRRIITVMLYLYIRKYIELTFCYEKTPVASGRPCDRITPWESIQLSRAMLHKGVVALQIETCACYTVKPRYNTVIFRQNTDKRYSIARPWGRDMEWLLSVQSLIHTSHFSCPWNIVLYKPCYNGVPLLLFLAYEFVCVNHNGNTYLLYKDKIWLMMCTFISVIITYVATQIWHAYLIN